MMLGLGSPSAVHVKLALPGDTTTWSIGGVVMTGLTGGGGGGGEGEGEGEGGEEERGGEERGEGEWEERWGGGEERGGGERR